MTQAAICDKCGRILPLGYGAFTITYKDYALAVDSEKVDLCKECFEKFKTEYLENLEQEGGGE